MHPDLRRSAVAVAHVLPADVRNHLIALAEGGVLRRVFTSFAYEPNRWLEKCARTCDRIVGTDVDCWLRRRPEIVGVQPADIRQSILPELLKWMGAIQSAKHSNSGAIADWTKKKISLKAARALKTSDRIVLGREFEAREIFEEAEKRDLVRLYQLPIAHYQTVERILRQEYELYPDENLRSLIETSFTEKRAERKQAELALASTILVPSGFVKDSLLDAGVEQQKIHTLPFGAESQWIAEFAPRKDGKMFLHVGQLSVRKGTHRLLRAWKRLKAHHTCELRLIGSMRLSATFLADFHGVYNFVGHIPRRSLNSHYLAATCFVLPSLAEGFAVVLLESLSCGTPIIASRNSGAEGFISDGVEGYIHDAQDDEQLCTALERMLSRPHRLDEMSNCCLEKARSWTWENYRAAFLDYLAPTLANPGEQIREHAIINT